MEWEISKACRILMGKTSWKYGYIMLDYRRIICDGRKWMELAHNNAQLQTFVRAVMNIRALLPQLVYFVRVQFPTGAGNFFTTASRTALGPTQPPTQRVPGVISLGVKWPRREAEHSPPSSAEVK